MEDLYAETVEEQDSGNYDQLEHVRVTFIKRFFKVSRNTTPWTPVQENAIEIAEDIVKYVVGMSCVSPPNRYSKVMRRTVSEISEKHEILFKGMSEKLGINEENVTSVIPNVFDEVFADGKFNWGRLVTVYAFAGWVARHFAQNEMINNVLRIGETAGIYVAVNLSQWIENNGGWDGFEAFFEKPPSTEKIIFYGLACTLISLGISAMATVLIVR